MIGLLLTVSEFFAQASDFISAEWAQLLALVGGTAGITAIATILVKIIATAISGKILKKNNVPINSTIDTLKNRIDDVEQTLEKVKDLLDQMPKEFGEQFSATFNKYNEAKKKVFNDIANGGEVEHTIVDLSNATIKATTPEIKQVEQIVDNIDKNGTKA